MMKRPVSITVIGCLFIAAGIVGITYHFREFIQRPFTYEVLWIFALRLLAILAGVFVLRGRNWARWILIAWIAYHVILSVFHSLSEVLMHGLLFVVITYFLCRPRAAAYFRRASVGEI
jgi:uncharacterized membrane protein HdeD (DUF308 family)